jgi:chorismate-pyruvate lyase
MKTNLYGNRKALNALNTSLLSDNGQYEFSRPLVASKTVEGHFRIEFVTTKPIGSIVFKDSLSTPTQKQEVTSLPETKEIVKDPWWVRLIRYIF